MTPPTEQDRYWLERLDQSYAADWPPEVIEQAIAWFANKEEVPRMLMRTEEAFGVRQLSKASWEPQLRALVGFLPDPEVVRYCCDHLADPNWPGWGVAWEGLVAQGPGIAPLVREVRASLDHDPDHQEQLDELLEELQST